MQIFIRRQGQQHGPHTIAQINAFLEAGFLNADDLAWYDGLPNWISVSHLPGVILQPTSPGAAPAPSVPFALGQGKSKLSRWAIVGGVLIALVVAIAMFWVVNSPGCDDNDVLALVNNLIYKSQNRRDAIARAIYVAAAMSTNQTLQGAAPGLAFVSALDVTGNAFRKAVTVDLHAITTISTNGSAHTCQALARARLNSADSIVADMRFDAGVVEYTVRTADDGQHFTVRLTN